MLRLCHLLSEWASANDAPLLFSPIDLVHCGYFSFPLLFPLPFPHVSHDRLIPFLPAYPPYGFPFPVRVLSVQKMAFFTLKSLASKSLVFRTHVFTHGRKIPQTDSLRALGITGMYDCQQVSLPLGHSAWLIWARTRALTSPPRRRRRTGRGR